MCTPTRAALMTGRYPFRYGLQTLVIPSARTYGLPTDEWLLPQALKEAGYQTAIVGKWHLGHADRKYWPRQRGFDYQYGPLIGEIDYFTHEQAWRAGLVSQQQAGQGRRAMPRSLLGNDAVEAHQRARSATRRSISTSTFNAPHTPYQAPQEYLDRYKNIDDPTRRAYAAMITCHGRRDRQRGRRARQEEDARQHAHRLPERQRRQRATPCSPADGDMSKIKIPCDNGPYRDGKGMLYEGGTRVAALANWPGHIKAGDGERNDPRRGHVPDAGRAGWRQRPTKAKPLDGLDVWPTISEGKPSPRPEVVYNVEPFRAGLRQGDWKLIWRTPLPSALELYNIAQDPSEKNQPRRQEPAKGC